MTRGPSCVPLKGVQAYVVFQEDHILRHLHLAFAVSSVSEQKIHGTPRYKIFMFIDHEARTDAVPKQNLPDVSLLGTLNSKCL